MSFQRYNTSLGALFPAASSISCNVKKYSDSYNQQKEQFHWLRDDKFDLSLGRWDQFFLIGF